MSKKPDGKKAKADNKNGNKALTVKPKKVVTAKIHGTKPDFTPKAVRLQISPEDQTKKVYAESCHELGRLAVAQVGQYGLQDETGTIILFLTINAKGKGVIHIVHSTVHGILPSDNWHIPVSTLRYEELSEGVTTGPLLEWQKRVHAFIRKQVQPFLVTRVPGLAEKMAEAYIETPLEVKTPIATPVAKTVIEKMIVDTTGAKPMNVAAFLGVNKNESVLYFHQEGDVRAFFQAEVIAGNQAVTLVHAEQGHSMFRALADHQKVVVHLATLKNQTGPYSDDLTQIKTARECVRQFLRAIAQSFGLKPRQQNDEESATNKAQRTS